MKDKIKNSYIFDTVTVTFDEMSKYETEIMDKYFKEWKEAEISNELQFIMIAILSKYQVDLKDKLYMIKKGRTENEY